ncbi:MAG: 1-acyl-sn-glycerol-3-phosphate acyltransferase [Clostridiaceae bacterium]
MQDSFVRFDMLAFPKKQRLRPIAWAISYPDVWKHQAKIQKINMEGIKPPYVLLCNHNAFLDFKVTTAAIFPSRANYVVAIDGFTSPTKNGFSSREWLLRVVGCICKRKFTNDAVLVRQLARVVKNGDIAVLYPEARYSLCGTNAILPESLGKLCKLLRVPVVSLIMHGHHVNAPVWNLKDRGVKPVESEMTCLFTAETLAKASAEEVNQAIHAAFEYDDFAWQRAHGIRVTTPNRAEGLHKVLYQCPHCQTEYQMESKGSQLICSACKKRWEMDELGSLHAVDGETEFSHIPDWYEWERVNVRREVEAGTYAFYAPVRVMSLPNAKGYIHIGDGTLTHNMEGFVVRGSGAYGDFEMVKPVPSLYSCHIELDYLGKYGDCVDLNTLEDTWYCYPQSHDYAVTKIALATEELYQHHIRSKKTEA